MPFFDLDNFLKAAQAILQGRDPYMLPDVYYPLPLYLVFVPLASLPLPVVHALWTAIEALILVVILRRRALAVLLFMPVLLTFLMGQIVMPMLGIFALLRTRLFGGIALALLLLKPQLGLFIAPWMFWQWLRNDRRQIVWCAVMLAVLAIAGFVVQPDWLQRWLAVGGRRLRAPISPSLWGVLSFLPTPAWIVVAGLTMVALFAWAWRHNDFDLITAAGFLVNPVSISYDLTLLTVVLHDARAWLGITLISWLSFAISAWQLNEGAYVLTTLAVIGVLLTRKPRVA